MGIALSALSRRGFLATSAIGGLLAAGTFAGCAVSTTNHGTDASTERDTAPLPPACPRIDDPFLIDEHVNMDSIDDFLNLENVVYRDMRLVRDPADYASIGGNAELSVTLEGFEITPFPWIGTLQELPVEGAYDGPRLFEIAWNEDGTVQSATANYEQSLQIVEELFPKDRAIVLMCGGAGYAFMMRQLLVHLGWDESLLYNAGGAWDYAGYHPVELISYDENGTPSYFLWRAPLLFLDFTYLTPVQ